MNIKFKIKIYKFILISSYKIILTEFVLFIDIQSGWVQFWSSEVGANHANTIKQNYHNTLCHSQPLENNFKIKILAVVILPKFKQIMIKNYLFCY